MMQRIITQCIVPEAHSGKRCDQAASALFTDYSRSCLQHWLRQGMLRVDGRSCKPKDKVFPGQVLSLSVVLSDESEILAEDVPFPVVYEDHQILVVDKPAGLVVHPGAGQATGTLQNGLLYRYPSHAHLPRTGIVHRLDKDTTGLMVVAKTLTAHTHLVEQLQHRTVKRHYQALCEGHCAIEGCVDAPVGRHPLQRVKMAVVAGGKPAKTDYRVLERFRRHSLLQLQLHTGRTHQIRVHMQHIGHPLVGDPTYNRKPTKHATLPEKVFHVLCGLQRQALHAVQLGLYHPTTGQWMQWQTPLPDDFTHVLNALRDDANTQDATTP